MGDENKRIRIPTLKNGVISSSTYQEIFGEETGTLLENKEKESQNTLYKKIFNNDLSFENNKIIYNDLLFSINNIFNEDNNTG